MTITKTLPEFELIQCSTLFPAIVRYNKYPSGYFAAPIGFSHKIKDDNQRGTSYILYAQRIRYMRYICYSPLFVLCSLSSSDVHRAFRVITGHEELFLLHYIIVYYSLPVTGGCCDCC